MEKAWHPTPVLSPGKSMDRGAWWAAVHRVAKSRTRRSDFTFNFHFHELEKEMATRSSILAWRIPGTGEPGGLPSMGSHRVGHDWSDLAVAAVQFSCSVMSNSLQPRGSQHTRPPYPSPTPGVHTNSCPSSWWCHPAISSSVIPFSSSPQSLPASRSFQMSQHFPWGGQGIGVSASASVLPTNIQDWFPLGWIDWISL